MKQKSVLLFLSFFLFSLYQLYAQAPTITGISSYTGVPGKQVFVYGTNFSDTVSNNTVWFGKVKGTVTAASSTQLTVTIPFGAMNGPIDVNTRGLYAKSGFDFVPTFKGNHAGFTSANKFATNLSHVSRVTSLAGETYDVNVGDLDGDSRLDLIVYHSTSDTIPRLFRNLNTPGRTDSFAAPILLNIYKPIDIKIADLNGDNKLDLLFVSRDSLFVVKNNSVPGNVSFGSPVFLMNFTNYLLYSLKDFYNVSDLDFDGKKDIVFSSTPNMIFALKNQSSLNSMNNSTFNLVLLGRHTISNSSIKLALIDIDVDGQPELFFARTGTGSTLNDTIFFWKHNGVNGVLDSISYSLKFHLNTIPNTSAFNPLVKDIDVDGKPDFFWRAIISSSVVEMRLHKNVHVSGNPSSVSFTAPLSFNSFTVDYEFSDLADLSGDGFPDLFAPKPFASTNEGEIRVNNSTQGNIPINLFNSFFRNVNDSGIALSHLVDMDEDGRIDCLMSRKIGSSSPYSHTISIRRNQLEFLPPATAGTVSVLSQTNTSATLLVNKGDGMGRAILIGANFSLTAGDTMNSIGNYTANTQYGAGTQVHPGLYLLHLGDADTITVTGLSPNTNYTIMVIEYNSIVNPRAYFNFMPVLSYLSTLPVKLVSFTAEKKEEDVLLNWKTASEENNARFDIERKTPQGDWEVVGSVKGNGTTNIPQYYHHTDNEAFTQTGSHTLFYRLNQIDYDGSEHYSPVVTVNKPLLATTINIQPNPNEGLFEVVFPSNTITGTIRVTNLLGTTIYEHPIEGNIQTLDLSAYKGLLLVQIISGNEVITKKVLVR